MSNLIQFYNDDKKTELAYPLVHKNGIVNEDGTSTIETIEKKNNAKYERIKREYE